jgi:hypothetical protein
MRETIKRNQEKCEAVFRPIARQTVKRNQEKCEAVFRPIARQTKKQLLDQLHARMVATQ